MDIFNIGTAIKSLTQLHLMNSRQTGRTTMMVESLKDGDRVVFINRRQADLVKRLCKEKGIVIDCIAIHPKHAHQIIEKRPSEGRAIFDHQWVEEFHLLSLDKSIESLDFLQKQSSNCRLKEEDLIEMQPICDKDRKWMRL